MPGMMDTVLNLGIAADVARVLIEEAGDASWAQDTLHRFDEQYRKVVGTPPPDDPWQQLEATVAAVFESWRSPRAIAYREHHGIPDDGGTAVTVQAMVFGNADDRSGTGVLFTRNPIEASRDPLGEWLTRGQGDDVVSGTSTPRHLAELATILPDAHAELMRSAEVLERTFADVQDIEFTIESGRLWLLQTRAAKRSARAAVHHAVQLQVEGLISIETALARITPAEVRAVLTPHVDPVTAGAATVLARGATGCPGVASGIVVGEADDAEDLALEGTAVVLARPTTDPDDVHGMFAALAVITEIGGTTSHAAVVSRELNRPSIVGCGVGMLMPLVGREVTVDATGGVVYNGRLDILGPSAEQHPDLAVVATWLQSPELAAHPLRAVLPGQ
jgi:pyruvate,orthophosphate dikinase